MQQIIREQLIIKVDSPLILFIHPSAILRYYICVFALQESDKLDPAMREIPVTSPRPRLRTYLAAGYALLIVYASLSPFTGWQEQGLEFSAVLAAPLLQAYTLSDAVVNLLAYIPFGLLLGLALRAHFGAGLSALLATLGGVVLSATMEYTQMYLPVRTSSNLDLLTNSIGALAGVLLAVSIAPRAWFALHLRHWRMRLFHADASMDFGLALVALWMFAQVNPSLPMLGNVFISEVARPPFAVVQPEPFNWVESGAQFDDDGDVAADPAAPAPPCGERTVADPVRGGADQVCCCRRVA